MLFVFCLKLPLHLVPNFINIFFFSIYNSKKYIISEIYFIWLINRLKHTDFNLIIIRFINFQIFPL